MRFCFHSRWVLSAILICVITAANAAYESDDGNSARGNNTNETLGNKTSQVKSILQREISTVENEVGDIEETINTELKIIRLQDSCECIQYNCGCCQHLEEPTIHLNSTVCANVTYLSQDIGISVTVTVNGYAVFNETVSVRNPPPVCLGVPYVKEWAEACVRFYDIDATRSHLHACAEVEARMKHFLIAKYELGCFDIGPITLKASAGEQQYANEPPSVMLTVQVQL
ncbi:Uncharacterized protein GBIM_08383, partial [Gryllus bimaculatus]